MTLLLHNIVTGIDHSQGFQAGPEIFSSYLCIFPRLLLIYFNGVNTENIEDPLPTLQKKLVPSPKGMLQLLLNYNTVLPLRKHAYSNIWKISPPKTENFQIKNADIFHISAQNIDCGTR